LELSAKLKLKNTNSLFVSSELPWAFSGLFVISKTKEHAEICKEFYKNSSMGKVKNFCILYTLTGGLLIVDIRLYKSVIPMPVLEFTETRT